ncbi:MAG: HAMP domain-containing histidine kinase [Chloroflexi bacterium]|nr:HAMP domain-containing histidine kinase [Chloroflexota bacterium]
MSLIVALFTRNGLSGRLSARSILLTFGFVALAALLLLSSLTISYLLSNQTPSPIFFRSLFLSIPVTTLFFVLAHLPWTAATEKLIITRRWRLLILNIVLFVVYLFAAFKLPSMESNFINPTLPYLVSLASIMALVGIAWHAINTTKRKQTPFERRLAVAYILLAEAQICLTWGLPDTLSWLLYQPLILAALAVILTAALKRTMMFQREQRRRSELTQLIVHDLKSPLTIVISGLGLLNRGHLGAMEETQQRLVQDLEHCSYEVLHMIDDMLDVERLEEDVLSLHRMPTNPLSILQDQITDVQILARSNKQTLTFSFVEPLPRIHVDRGMMVRVVRNLLANAIKFTPQKGQIQVTSYADQTYLTIVVADSGPGVPLAERERIFLKFAQTKGGIRRGTGLGLTFCKMVVDAHNGSLTVDDSTLGGAQFKVILPLYESSHEDALLTSQWPLPPTHSIQSEI